MLLLCGAQTRNSRELALPLRKVTTLALGRNVVAVVQALLCGWRVLAGSSSGSGGTGALAEHVDRTGERRPSALLVGFDGRAARRR